VAAKLYVILGSHACRTGMLLLEHKGIAYERVVLPTGLHPVALRVVGFSGNPTPFRRAGERRAPLLGALDRMGTVPALRIDGQRIKTNREIARFLDGLRPDPPLFPADPERRRAVEEAEAWGDDVFQMAARRMGLVAALAGGAGLVAKGADGRLGPLLWRNTTMRVHAIRAVQRVFAADERAEMELRAALPGMLDRIDGWIEGGVLDGERLYAADYMIAPSLALLTYVRDMRPEIERRPAQRLVDRVLPISQPIPQSSRSLR
jgi:glutathione S-transferase